VCMCGVVLYCMCGRVSVGSVSVVVVVVRICV
jgi:hypothetical protein